MEAKGHVWIKKEFTATRLWPSRHFTLNGWVDLEQEYKTALAGQLVTVMDIAVDGSAYMVLGDAKSTGPFVWTVEKEDTRGFLPVIVKNGQLIPAGLSPMEEFVFMARNMAEEAKHYKF